MANRRSLGEAMTLSPETRNFIQGPTKVPEAPVEPVKPKNLTAVESGAVLSANQETADEPKFSEPLQVTAGASARRTRSRSSREPLPDSSTGFGQAGLMAPLTTRLHPVTAAALKRAGLEQKLRGLEPATVQEIVEIAVSHWLRQQNYL